MTSENLPSLPENLPPEIFSEILKKLDSFKDWWCLLRVNRLVASLCLRSCFSQITKLTLADSCSPWMLSWGKKFRVVDGVCHGGDHICIHQFLSEENVWNLLRKLWKISRISICHNFGAPAGRLVGFSSVMAGIGTMGWNVKRLEHEIMAEHRYTGARAIMPQLREALTVLAPTLEELVLRQTFRSAYQLSVLSEIELCHRLKFLSVKYLPNTSPFPLVWRAIFSKPIAELEISADSSALWKISMDWVAELLLHLGGTLKRLQLDPIQPDTSSLGYLCTKLLSKLHLHTKECADFGSTALVLYDCSLEGNFRDLFRVFPKLQLLAVGRGPLEQMLELALIFLNLHYKAKGQETFCLCSPSSWFDVDETARLIAEKCGASVELKFYDPYRTWKTGREEVRKLSLTKGTATVELHASTAPAFSVFVKEFMRRV